MGACIIYHCVGPSEIMGRWGTSYHLALVELDSCTLLASPSLSLSLSSLSGALPCWCRDGGMGFWEWDCEGEE